MSAPIPTRVRRALRSALLHALIAAAMRLPLRAGLALGSLAGRAGWLLASRTRRLAREQLALAFPERTAAELDAIARDCFLHLGRVAGETLAIRSYDARLEDYVSFAPGALETLQGLLARGRGLVFVTGHVGNWELLARRVARAGIPNMVIAKAGPDRRLNALADRFRASGGVTTLWREEPSTGRALLRCFKEGKALGILVDQDTRVQGVFVPFFGRAAFTPRAAGDLALRFQAPVVAAWCRRRGPRPGDGHEVCAVEVPFDASAADREAESVRITAACTAALERAIRERPAEWVWWHERWKTRPPERPAQASPVPKSSELSAG